MKKLSIKIALVFIAANLLFYASIYVFDKNMFPTAMIIADAEMRAKSLDIINQCILEEYSKNFKYNQIIKVDKDKDGNIVMLQADTLKLNEIANNITIRSKKELTALGQQGIKLPMGIILKNSVLSQYGPKVTVRMMPIGRIETTYRSELKGAGINQVIHRIYVEIKTKMRIVIAARSSEIEVKNEVPICETVIVGKVPNTSINMDMSSAKSSLPIDKKYK